MSDIVTSYPVLDWASLRKGQTLDVVACCTAMGVSAAMWRADRFLAERLKDAIRSHRDDLSAHVRCVGDGIEILDDAGANEYTWAEARRGARLIARQARRRGAIDVSQLDDAQRRIAEARDGALGRLRLAAARELRETKKLTGPDGSE